MARLLDRVRHTASEPELFAGLVHACRYCGLLDASVAAYERARRLDPGVVTSVAQTFLLMGEWERAMAADRSDPPFTTAMALVQLGRARRGTRVAASGRRARGLHPQLHNLLNGMIAALEGRHDEVIRQTYQLVDSGFGDPEVFYHWAAALAQAGDHDGALGLLERSHRWRIPPGVGARARPAFRPGARHARTSARSCGAPTSCSGKRSRRFVPRTVRGCWGFLRCHRKAPER